MDSEKGRPRTLFGELVRQRGRTAEEFSEDAELYAREHGLDATLSPRHVHRLMSGCRADGRPLGPVRAGTRKLLEEMFSVPVDQLLRPVPAAQVEQFDSSDDALRLRARIAAGRNVDAQTIELLRQKLDITRVIDRRLGASALLGELRGQIAQMEQALGNTLNQAVRSSLAEVLVDASTLAGWQSLDQGLMSDAWNHYNCARTAAREADSRELEAYACAGQAVVLLDIGDTRAAVELTNHASTIAKGRTSKLLYSWLTAGYGEACAADGRPRECLSAFDDALRLMTDRPEFAESPYLVFGPTHLDRWRSNALARLGEPEAISLLSDVLDKLDPTFTRAATALRVDLVQVFTATGEKAAAAEHAQHARLLAAQIGSTRQRKRLDAVLA
jgi:tetratricopeptide (TPR) repeat protein